MAKIISYHKDALGRTIKADDKLAVARHNVLYICRIVKLTPKQIRAERIATGGDFLVYPSNVLIIDGEDAVMYMLAGGF